MDQYQPNEAQESALAQTIINIDKHFDNIQSQINDEFPKIPINSTVLIFLGEFGKQFDNFYDHFETQEVIQDKKQYKLIKIEQQGKISFLLNFPMILLYDDQNDEIAENLCISKIYAEMALKQMETCSFYLILDNQQLQGDNDLAKLDNVIKDSIFYFGSYYFNENKFFLLRHQIENKWSYQQFSKQNDYLSNFLNNQQLQTQKQTVSQNEILKEIFQSDNKINVQKVKSEDQINYGKMITYLTKKQDLLKEQFNKNIQDFQKLLLYLQQMPIMSNNPEIIKEVEKYLKELYQDSNDKKNPLNDQASQIGSVYQFINSVNKGENAKKINKRQSKIFSPQMKQFQKDNKIEQLKIEPLLSDDLYVKLNSIIQFFIKYHNRYIKNDKISEVQKLKLNLKYWCTYCNESLENTLYDLKYITQRIQEGPENEIENGIYFIGITKVGKSTIINSLLNPHKIVKQEFLMKKCYGIEMETKFKIGQGGVSETQKINGVYIGKQEELNKIFKQGEQNIFSLEEVLDQNQIQNFQIPQKWFIFDCPGFDDNNNDFMRIAHRISLYNYFSKTKNITVFFVVDISSEQMEQIKNTFDPISYLLEDKIALEDHFQEWTNLILSKAKDGQRQQYLENWDKVYKGYLDQDYSFYKKLFENDQRCIEFPKPSKNIKENIQKLSDSIIDILKSQFEQKERFHPKFKLVLDDKVWMLYQQCIPKAKLKLQQLITFLIEDLVQYILESCDSIEIKKEYMLKIQKCLFNQRTQQMINLITYENCEQILQGLSNLVRGNNYLKNTDFFLQLCFEDMKSILTISKYCENNNNLASFEIKIDQLVNMIATILQKIEEANQQLQNWKYCGYATYFMAGIITSNGTSLTLDKYQFFANFLSQFLLTRGTLYVANQASEIFKLNTGLRFGWIESWKNTILKENFQFELKKQKQQEEQQLSQQQEQQQA